ncbi:MAG: UbiD family decarboxylase [Thermoplasmatales archaeon]
MNKSTNLRGFIEKLDELGMLKTISGADWNLEIGALTDANAKSNKYTLLFDNIKGYPGGFRVLTGALLDAPRVSLALGFESQISNLQLAHLIKDKIMKNGNRTGEFSPKFVNSAPVMENIDNGGKIDIFKFPSPKWFHKDGGRYIGTLDAVITRDPETGWVNVGTYRVMIKEKNKLAILMEASRHGRNHYQKYMNMGQECPVAISFGHDPGINLFAGTEVPDGISEYNFLGSIREEPVNVIKGPITGLPIPADSEISIEGYITGEKTEEGPLGEFTGYYGGGKMVNPVIRIEAVYYRNDPILLGTCAGKPPYDYSYFRCPVRAALIWNSLEAAGISGINGVWCHEEGYSRAFTTVAIKQTYGGHAVMAGHIASQCRPGAVAGRYTVVVDEDIDPSNLNEVVWAMCSRNDPATGIHVIKDTMGTPLDPISKQEEGKDLLEFTSSRAIILAVKPFGSVIRKNFPEVVKADAITDETIRKKWADVLKEK